MSHKIEKFSVMAVIAGNVVEWYDFTLYVFLAPIIAHNFFPQYSHLKAMLSTFLIFAIGFFVRPIGSIIFGHLGDRLGRVTTLKINILLLSIPAIGIALLPTYEQLGIYATYCLVVFRLLQGLCIGGEFAGSMIYLVEASDSNKRAFTSCMSNNGSNLGILCATLIASIISSGMPEADFYSYGWRLAFMLGGIIGLLGLWLRRNIIETPVFNALLLQKNQPSMPILTILRKHKMNVVHIFLLLVMPAIGNYILIDFMSTYLNQYFNYSLNDALKIQTIYIILTFGLIIIAAWFSDRYGRRITLTIAALGYITCCIPCFYLLASGSSWLCLLPLVMFYSIEQSTTPATMVEMFPAHVRYSGISLGYNLAMALVGGTAPLVTTWLIAKFNNPLILPYYLLVAAIVSLTIILTKLPKEYGQARDLIENET